MKPPVSVALRLGKQRAPVFFRKIGIRLGRQRKSPLERSTPPAGGGRCVLCLLLHDTVG